MVKSIEEVFMSEYVIPLYQRNFAWKEDQILKLLQDIYQAFLEWHKTKTDSSNYEKSQNYYLGTLVVKERDDGRMEVIDGQQRLTVLSLIKRELDPNFSNRLFYDSREEVSSYLSIKDREIYSNGNNFPHSLSNLIEAVNTIIDAQWDPKEQSNISVNMDSLLAQSATRNDKGKSEVNFQNFFMKNVKLVCVTIPKDTDVASYFEIMNNRGEQLKEHELLKARFLAKLKNFPEKRAEFSKIWDACADLSEPIQTLFSADLRKRYFCDDYQGFNFHRLGEVVINDETGKTDSLSIHDILATTQLTTATKTIPKLNLVDDAKVTPIIDFPNFLMHILKLFKPDCSLDSKFLLTYDFESINPDEFIRRLLFIRVCFDQFIIKGYSDPKKEEGFSWKIQRAVWSNSGSAYLKQTFKQQDRIIQAQSMLQVSFRTRNYKNWLFELIKWFDATLYTDSKVPIEINCENSFIHKLDKIVLKRYKNLRINFSNSDNVSLGTQTPHYLLNFIDYLLWVSKKQEKELSFVLEPDILKRINTIKDFEFKYWNSVEHHLAVQKAKDNGLTDVVDSLGNLYLISRGSNSRLSDRDVKEKVKYYKSSNMGANRQIIYSITEDDPQYRWEREEIKNHNIRLRALIERRYEILKLKSNVLNSRVRG